PPANRVNPHIHPHMKRIKNIPPAPERSIAPFCSPRIRRREKDRSPWSLKLCLPRGARPETTNAPGTPAKQTRHLCGTEGIKEYAEASAPPEHRGGDRCCGRGVDGGYGVERGDSAPGAWPLVQARQPGGEPVGVRRNVEPAHCRRDSATARL